MPATAVFYHLMRAGLDETVLTFAQKDDQAAWAKPLQAEFFNHHQAGEFLYEDMQAVLGDPAPDRQVLTVFQRVLMLAEPHNIKEPRAFLATTAGRLLIDGARRRVERARAQPEQRRTHVLVRVEGESQGGRIRRRRRRRRRRRCSISPPFCIPSCCPNGNR